MKLNTLTTAILLILTLTACSDDDDTGSPSNETPTSPISPETPTSPLDPEPPLNLPEEPNTPTPEPEPEVPTVEVPVPKVYLDEDFKNLTALPEAWTLSAKSVGEAYIKDGHLFIDGLKHNTTMTTLMLAPKYENLRNYRIDIEFTHVKSNNTGRWSSIVHRAASNPAIIPYYQFAIRTDATASNGLELAYREANDTWNVLSKTGHTHKIDPTKTHKASVVVHGNRIHHYLDDKLVLDTTLHQNLEQGGIGLSTAGLLMRVDSIKISEQLDPLPDTNKVTALIDHQLPVSMAPTLAQPVPTSRIASTSATHVAYILDEQLNLLNAENKKVMHLRDYLSNTERRSIPLLNIQSTKTIDSLKALGPSYDLSDITLVSDQPELLRTARIAIPTLRTALNYSQHSGFTSSNRDIMTIVHNTNSSLSKIVILPPQLVTRDVVSHFQRLLITPWAGSNTTDPVKAAQILTTGVNGIYASQPDVFMNIMKNMAPNTLLRKPLITGHRGIPGELDENTLEGAIRAIEVGADAVESDIYLTKDGHIVVMHDGTLKRTTGDNRKIEDLTLAEVRQLRTIPGGFKVPTLEELLIAVKAHPKVMNFIEIKSSKPEIVPALKRLLDQHDVYDQSIVISFDAAQVLHMKNVLPGVSTGFLTSTPQTPNNLENTRTILAATQKYASTFNPSFTGLNKELMGMASQRGVTFWPWTFRLNKDDFNRMYVQGTHGLTTDYARDAADFVVKLDVPPAVNATVGKALEISGSTLTQVGAKTGYTFKEMMVLPQSAKYTQNGQAVTFTEKGTAYVMPKFNYTIAPNHTYTLYAPPVKVTIQ